MTAPSLKEHDDLASLEAGLDALDTEQVRAESGLVRVLKGVWPPVVFFALFLLVWELAYRSGWKQPYQLPSPADVFLDLREQLGNGRLLGAMQTSLQRGGLGFLVAVAIGTPLGLLIARVRLVRRGLGPFISGLQSLPSVAITEDLRAEIRRHGGQS